MRKSSKVYLITLVILVACILRAPITCVGSVTNIIREGIDVSTGTIGLLSTVPLVSFAIASLITFFLSNKIPAGNLFIGSLLLLVLGIVARSYLGVVGLYGGTAAIGLGIGVCNVLIPGVIKSEFPRKIETLTSVYTAVMQITSAIATAISVPLAMYLGWKGSLGVWIFPAVIALIYAFFGRGFKLSAEDISLSFQSKTRDENKVIALRKRENQPKKSFFKKKMAWCISIYMGVQSLLFYSYIAWLTPFLQDRGFSIKASGYVLALYVVMGILGSLALPIMMKVNKNLSILGVEMGGGYLIAILITLIFKDPVLIIISTIICGFLSGTCISFSMALFGIHTSNGKDAAKISAMAQCVGYLIAATGPVVIGWIYGAQENWTMSFVLLEICASILVILGNKVGKKEIL